MRVVDLRSEQKAARARVSATVIWEDCDRATHDVYFETDESFSDYLTCNPHAFLVACSIPAMHYGEKRIAMDAEVCPELIDGLSVAMHWLRHWYYPLDRDLVQLEVKPLAVVKPHTSNRAGFFFSGGIDSYATLRANRIHVPAGHPSSIKDGLLVYGLELDDPVAFEHVKHSLSDAAEEIGITLISVYTNIYLHFRQEDAGNRFKFWTHEYTGAALAAAAHAFTKRLNVVSIPASVDLHACSLLKRENIEPYGSHPLLDPNYSSSDLRIKVDNFTLSRLNKTRLVAEWDTALQHLRVCNHYKQYKTDKLNCGACEKCVRTMLTLLALGALEKTNAFPAKAVSAKMVLQQKITPYFYLDLLPALKEVGRDDLVSAVEHGLLDYQRSQKREVRKDYMKRIDRTYLKGNVYRFKKLFSH